MMDEMKVKTTTINNHVLPLWDENDSRGWDPQKQHVFIIGSKGIPAAYGGFETFVDKLTEYQKSDLIQYHVARVSNDNTVFSYNGARVFDCKVPDTGSSRAVLYDLMALNQCIDYCKAHHIEHPIFYILACRIGPFIAHYKKAIEKIGGVLLLNPDGHEWMRDKWSAPIQWYWKKSEKQMVKAADLVVCDSVNIERYIQDDYQAFRPSTTYIAYGADLSRSPLADDDEKFTRWMQRHGLTPKDYYLVVARFVPENNFEVMIREFMKSSTNKDFVIITNPDSHLFQDLENKLHFSRDPRIKFVGTVYDQDLLKKIREQAYGNFHGHEVGGTNPSLLEALVSTDLNLLLNVGFNREVGRDAALYWNKEDGHLASLIEQADAMSDAEIEEMARKSTKRIADAYSWEAITSQYERIFEGRHPMMISMDQAS